jgi:hypothetical protein
VLFIVYLTPLLVRGWRFVVNGKPQGKWIMIIVVGQLFISVSEPPYLLGFFSAIGLLYGATARYLSAGSVESGEEPLSASTIR